MAQSGYELQVKQPSGQAASLLSSNKGGPPPPNASHGRNSLRERSAAFLKNVGVKGISFLWRSANKETQEKRKIALKSGRWSATNRCWVHVVPVAATAVLAYLNISGFYIGGDLEGFSGQYSLEVKLLAFQVTAKLFELLIVGSAATVVLDVFRNELMFGDDGVPLGLIGADMQFSAISFFYSPEFLSGRKAFARWYKRWAITLLLFYCGLIALFGGPASALLLIPVYQEHFSAGGTDYFLVGTQQSLFPETLDINSVGFGFEFDCLNPSAEEVYTNVISSSGCIWSGYSPLVSTYRNLHQNHFINLTITDGIVTRLLQAYKDQVTESFTIAPNVAAAAPTYDMTNAYIDVIQSLGGISSAAHYKRLPFGVGVRMSGYVPSVRTACVFNANFAFPDNNNTWTYPFLPEVGPVAPFQYALNPGKILKSPTVSMQWREIPKGSSPTTDGGTTDYYPSAFLDLAIPHGGSEELGAFYTCSVDARWVRADTVGTDFDSEVEGKYFVLGEDLRPNPYFPYHEQYLPAHGALKMDLDWLNALTPILDDTLPGFTTLSSIFQAAGFDNAFTVQDVLLPNTESMIATVVADGLSRIGYAANGGAITLVAYRHAVFDRYNVTTSNFPTDVYKGTATLPPPTGFTEDKCTRFRWDVTIPGYAYRSDGVAYWLALTVLFAHCILALLHTAWSVARGTVSDSWDSLGELVALAQNSPPAPDVLANTCAGIEQSLTMRRTAKVRVVEADEDDEEAAGGANGRHGEQVQLLFGGAARNEWGRSMQVQLDVPYGAM